MPSKVVYLYIRNINSSDISNISIIRYTRYRFFKGDFETSKKRNISMYRKADIAVYRNFLRGTRYLIPDATKGDPRPRPNQPSPPPRPRLRSTEHPPGTPRRAKKLILFHVSDIIETFDTSTSRNLPYSDISGNSISQNVSKARQLGKHQKNECTRRTSTRYHTSNTNQSTGDPPPRPT